jgi:hypothetical protein
MKPRVACIALLAVATACSSAMQVQRAPGLGKTQYHHVVVAIGIDDLLLRRSAEEAFAVERASAADIIPSVAVLEANRGYEPEEMQRVFTQSGADAVAIVSVVRDGRDSVKYATVYPQRVCLLAAGGRCRQWGVGLPATEDTRPFMRFTVELYEMTTGRMMWTADIRTNGRNRDNSEAILRRLAHDVVAAWQKDGVLSRPSSVTSR